MTELVNPDILRESEAQRGFVRINFVLSSINTIFKKKTFPDEKLKGILEDFIEALNEAISRLNTLRKPLPQEVIDSLRKIRDSYRTHFANYDRQSVFIILYKSKKELEEVLKYQTLKA